MLETLLEVLRDSAADDFKIEMNAETAHEFFFIRHKLDMNRKKQVQKTIVTVYRQLPEGPYTGSASVKIPASFTKAEMTAKINEALFAAQFVENEAYSLWEGPFVKSEHQKLDAKQAAMELMAAIQGCEESEQAYLNSYEVFITEHKHRMITSKGVDVSYEYLDAMAEIVINASDGKHEIELYNMWNYGSVDPKRIRKQIADAMKRGIDRTKAKPMPKLQSMTVLFGGEDAVKLYDYFVEMSSASMKYQHISFYEKGMPICDEPIGDAITLRGLAYLEGSSLNAPFDGDGKPTQDRLVLEHGVCKAFHGPKRFMDYIGEADSGMVYNWSVEGGSHPEAELRRKPYLEPVEFSDFQVDSTTGDFAGEIRLAYWFDGEQTHIVTGGSLAGNMMKAQKEMYLSKETVQYNNYRIPSVTCIPQVSITGIE